MAKTKRIFQVFSSIPEHEKQNTMSKPKLLPTGVQANETPDTHCSNDTNAMYPIEVQQAQQANDKADEFKKSLPKYRKVCKKVLAADEVENNAGVEPLMPPVIS